MGGEEGKEMKLEQQASFSLVLGIFLFLRNFFRPFSAIYSPQIIAISKFAPHIIIFLNCPL